MKAVEWRKWLLYQGGMSSTPKVDFQVILNDWEEELEKSKAENKELQAVFDLQETRTKKAEHLWQQATGKHSTLPDLGVLLDWLMGEMKRSEERINDWRAMLRIETGLCMEWKDRAEKERCHRKWALKEMKIWKAAANSINEDCTYNYKQSEKFKAEVKCLKSFLLIVGIHS